MRRFNNFYGDVFPEPKELHTEVPVLPGTDGRKMSKSYGNAIYLIDSADVVREKARMMITDRTRIRRTDPGHPESCDVCQMHRFFLNSETADGFDDDCRNARIGCVDRKRALADSIIERYGAIAERSQKLRENPEQVIAIIKEGSRRAREEAQKTMTRSPPRNKNGLGVKMEEASTRTSESAAGFADVAPEFAESADQYKVKLPVFEGPLDLLLYLIRKEEVSIYDIPIARITAQYLDYLKAMRELDIAVAGEFLVMAATLIHIKSQMLLPRDPDAIEEAIEDPRSELVYQLLEHQKFKSAANMLHQRAMIEAATFTRADTETDQNNPEVAATVFQLFEVFREVLDRRRAITEIEIARDEMTMAEKIAEIKLTLEEKGELRAREMFERARSRRELVLVFLALLELVKELAIRLSQSETFGEIVITRRDEEIRQTSVGDAHG